MSKLIIPSGSVVAIDPGDHTGVVVVVGGMVAYSATLMWDEILDLIARDDDLIGCLTNYDNWVIESFVLYPWRAAQMGFDTVIPAQVIGALRVAIRRVPRISCSFQNAGTVKHFATDQKLKDLGWFDSLKTDHERDEIGRAHV